MSLYIVKNKQTNKQKTKNKKPPQYERRQAKFHSKNKTKKAVLNRISQVSILDSVHPLMSQIMKDLP